MYNKIKFICSLCGRESWFEVSIETYVITVKDLVCDDCLPEDDSVNFKIEAKMIEERKPDAEKEDIDPLDVARFFEKECIYYFKEKGCINKKKTRYGSNLCYQDMSRCEYYTPKEPTDAGRNGK